MPRFFITCLALCTLGLTSLGGCRRSPPTPGAASSPGGFALVPVRGDAPVDRQIAAAQAEVRRRPNDHARWVELARVFVRKARTSGDPGFYAQVREATDRALAIAPDDDEGQTLRGVLLLQDHRFADAEALGRRLIARDARSWSGWWILGDAQVERGEYREAVESYQHLLDLIPGQESYPRAAWLRWLTGDAAGAVELQRLAVNAGGPDDVEVWAWNTVELGRLFFFQGDLDAAQTQHEAALRRLPGYPRALYGVGQVLAARGQHGPAIDALRASVAASPLVETQWALGDALRHAGRQAEADEVYATLERQGARSDPRTFALYLATRGRDLDRAFELVRREHDARDDVYTTDVFAWTLFRMGHAQSALVAAERALSLGTRDARMLFHLGAIRRALGQRARSEEALRAALAANPYWNADQVAEARAWLAEADGGASSAAAPR